MEPRSLLRREPARPAAFSGDWKAKMQMTSP
jgi:hypothetical protein